MSITPSFPIEISESDRKSRVPRISRLLFYMVSILGVFMLFTPRTYASTYNFVTSDNFDTVYCATDFLVPYDGSSMSPFPFVGDFSNPYYFQHFNWINLNYTQGSPRVKLLYRPTGTNVRYASQEVPPSSSSSFTWDWQYQELPYDGLSNTMAPNAPNNGGDMMVCLTTTSNSIMGFDGMTLTDHLNVTHTLLNWQKFNIRFNDDPFDYYSPPIVDNIDITIQGQQPFNINEYYTIDVVPDINSFTPAWMCIYADPNNPNQLTDSVFQPQNNNTYNFQLNPYSYSAVYPIRVVTQDTLCADLPTNSYEESISITINGAQADSTVFISDTQFVSGGSVINFTYSIDTSYYGNITNAYIEWGLPETIDPHLTILNLSDTVSHTYPSIPPELLAITPSINFDSSLRGGGQSISINLFKDPFSNSIPIDDGSNYGGITNVGGNFYSFSTETDSYAKDSQIIFDYFVPSIPSYTHVSTTLNLNDTPGTVLPVSSVVLNTDQTYTLASGYSEDGLFFPFLTHTYTSSGSTDLVRSIFIGGDIKAPNNPLNIYDSEACGDVFNMGIFKYCGYFRFNDDHVSDSNVFVKPLLLGINAVLPYTFRTTSEIYRIIFATDLYTAVFSFFNPKDGTYQIEELFNDDSALKDVFNQPFTISRRTNNTNNLDYLIAYLIYLGLFYFLMKNIITFFDD